ncbi:MAG: hypothetical protein WBK37_05585 [Kiritimatiellia bacterium]|nr:hypothetical protein [Kiritimatiellia bacterium]
MRKALAVSFIGLGITSVMAQVLLVRELLIVFYGNEFFIGWTLFAWLVWTAIGVGVGGRVGQTPSSALRWLVVSHAATAVLLPGLLALIRAARTLLGVLPGSLPDLLPAMAFSLLVFAPLGLVLGAHFVVATRLRPAGAANGRPDAGGLGWGYVCETIGFVLGGVLFSFVFATASELRTLVLLGCLNALAGFGLCRGFHSRAGSLRVVLLMALAALLLLSTHARRWEWRTAAWRYPGQLLVAARTSIYGHLAVTAIGRQINFHENGALLGAEDEQQAAENLVHIPMLWHEQPRRVLLIGGGFNGALGEILKHQPAHVDYVELDAALIALARQYAAPSRQQALIDPRVHPIFADGRAFLNARAADATAEPYDVVILNLPGPSTVLLNRYYSREFFRDVRRLLASDGVLAVRLPFAPDYLCRELENLGVSIDRALRAEFPAVSLLPDYDLLYVASPSAAPEPTAATLQARYQVRGFRTEFVIPPAIAYRLTTDRVTQTATLFDRNTDTRLNRDSRPVACVYSFAYWLRLFHPRVADAVLRASARSWGWGAGGLLLLLLLMGSAVGARPAHLGPWAMGVGGFTMMGAELVLLLGFQIVHGHLYYKLALLLAACMAGMALGGWWGLRRTATATPRTLAKLHAVLAGYLLIMAGVFQLMAVGTWQHGTGGELAFLLLAVGAGVVVGWEFPLATRLHWAANPAAAARGAVYGADILGSCLGALLVSLWALPLYGIPATLLGLTALNLGLAAIARLPGSLHRTAPRHS